VADLAAVPEQAAESGLVVSDLVVSYAGARALNGVSLSVAPGQCVALMGPNGAGKSTMMRAVSRVLHLYNGSQDSGQIRFGSQDLTHAGPGDVVRAHVAQVPEGRKIFADLSLLDNLRVAVPRHARRHTKERVEQVLEYFPSLGARLDMHGGWLSGGEQQMLAISRALMTGPELLMIDELSLGLAPKVVFSIVEQLEVLRQELHIGVLLVEQNARLALEFSDFAYVIETGSVVHQGRSHDLAQDDRIERQYLGGGAVDASADRQEADA
jgi:branched-chain amino acid transport system ATP-binding protein